MDNKSNKILKVVFGVLLVLWFLPIIQSNLHLIEETQLSGSFTKSTDTTFTFKTWFSGDYQKVKEKYLEENFSLRNYFIKLNNQIAFNLFSTTRAQDVVIGKENYLYENKYLVSAEGLDYIGDAAVNQRVKMLKLIQDTLTKQGKLFFIMYAPSKVSYYPEFLPRSLKQTENTNYKKQIALANKAGINSLNLNQTFINLKGKIQFPLYPQTGTHWSVYGMHIALDTVCRYIERKTNTKLCKIDYSSSVLLDTLQGPDGDMENALNVFFPPKRYKMAYPAYVAIDSNNKTKPRVLVVSDSYWMGIYFTDLPKKIFKEHEFWYYNKQNYCWDNSKLMNDPNNYNLADMITKKDVISIMASEAQLRNFGWGFIERLYACYYPNDPYIRGLEKKIRIEQIKTAILSTPEWIGGIKKEAKNKGLVVDTLVNLNAEFIYSSEEKKNQK